MHPAYLAELVAFALVAEKSNFRAAANQLGITPSALSHRVRKLEQALDIRLLHRTTRSVVLTDAGRTFLEQLQPALEGISGAVEHLQHFHNGPTGKLTIYAAPHVAEIVIAPVWKTFLQAYPQVRLEVAGIDETVDIVARGYDAGIAPREHVNLDMIAVRVAPPLNVAVVASPGYFAEHAIPNNPGELSVHNCIQTRLPVSRALVDWAFARRGEIPDPAGKIDRVPVAGNLIVSDIQTAVRAAADGLGIAYVPAASAETFVRSGQLVRVLEEWSPVSDGLFLFYSGKHRVPPALRALIDMLRAQKREMQHDLDGRPLGNNLADKPVKWAGDRRLRKSHALPETSSGTGRTAVRAGARPCSLN